MVVVAVNSQLTALLAQQSTGPLVPGPSDHAEVGCDVAAVTSQESDMQIFQVLIVEDDAMQQVVMKELFSAANKASRVSDASCSYPTRTR